MKNMKKIILFFIFVILFLSFSFSIFAASYEQTAADIGPGVFADGSYYFSSTVYLGTDDDPGLASAYDPSVYISNGDNNYGLYVKEEDGEAAIFAYATSTDAEAVLGASVDGRGVKGTTQSSDSSNAGVYGYADSGASGVIGYDASGSGIGVKAYSSKYGFYTSGADYGLYIPDADTYGVYAISDSVGGKFTGDSYGVLGKSDGIGGYFSGDLVGVYGTSSSSSSLQCGVQAYNSDSGYTGYLGCSNYGIYTPNSAKVGSCSGCDIAEHFLGEQLEPGNVVVLDPAKLRKVTKTNIPYNKLAVGIVSTDPTIIMGIDDGIPIALSGVVPTKVIGTVHIGDLLTTSSTPGYAMACADMQKCQGAIIGKAMEEHSAGRGTITVLVMLG